MGACLALANCSSQTTSFSRLDPKYGVSSSPRVVGAGEAVPKGGGTYRVGKPYVVAGRTYVPEENANYRAEGMASWYGDAFHGRLTANGEVFDMASLTAAHPTLPIPSYARVTNVKNGKSLIVRVNDRGPYHGNRLIDVSNKAAELRFAVPIIHPAFADIDIRSYGEQWTADRHEIGRASCRERV